MKCESYLPKKKLVLMMFLYKEKNVIVQTQDRFEFLARLNANLIHEELAS